MYAKDLLEVVARDYNTLSNKAKSEYRMLLTEAEIIITTAMKQARFEALEDAAFYIDDKLCYNKELRQFTTSKQDTNKIDETINILRTLSYDIRKLIKTTMAKYNRSSNGRKEEAR